MHLVAIASSIPNQLTKTAVTSHHITKNPEQQQTPKTPIDKMTDPDFLEVPPMTVLETDRLRLRTVRVADAKAIMPMITDKVTMKFTSGVVADDLEVAERWLSARVLGKDVLNFVVTLKNDGKELGKDGNGEGKEEQIVGIMGSYHWPEVGYLMHPGKSAHGVSCPYRSFELDLSAVW